MKYLTLIGRIVLCTTFIAINSCKSNEVSDPITIPKDAKVLIIGAGASGLNAAKTLLDNNVDFTVLEASDRIGGRLKKNDTFTDFPLDLGAEWIHGEKSKTYYWAKQQGITVVKDKTKGLLFYKEKLYTEKKIPEELFPLLEYIIEGAGSSKDQSLKNWAIDKGYGSEVYDILESTSNDSGGSASLLSARNAMLEEEEWSAGENDYKVRDKTYFDLVYNTLVPNIKDSIILNSPVTKINYSGEKVVVIANGKNYEADRVIITVPLKVLKNKYITFEPKLPLSKRKAIDKIGMEAGVKVFLKFSTNFFAGKSVSGAKIGPFYYDASYGKSSSTPILGLFATGNKAQKISVMTEATAVQFILKELDQIFKDKATANYTGEYLIQDWTKEPFIGGAYSYATVGMGNAREKLAASVKNKLFFAGEATHLKGHNSTVQGALETGKREANKVLNSFN